MTRGWPYTAPSSGASHALTRVPTGARPLATPVRALSWWYVGQSDSETGLLVLGETLDAMTLGSGLRGGPPLPWLPLHPARRTAAKAVVSIALISTARDYSHERQHRCDRAGSGLDRVGQGAARVDDGLAPRLAAGLEEQGFSV